MRGRTFTGLRSPIDMSGEGVNTAASSHPGDDALECAACSYNLSTIADDGRCPECGLARRESVATLRAWSPHRLRAAWPMREMRTAPRR